MIKNLLSGLSGKTGLGIVTLLIPAIANATGNEFTGDDVVALVGAIQTIVGLLDKFRKKFIGKK